VDTPTDSTMLCLRNNLGSNPSTALDRAEHHLLLL
jgi:hypothetical protein